MLAKLVVAASQNASAHFNSSLERIGDSATFLN
jgi:hypothetical protein